MSAHRIRAALLAALMGVLASACVAVNTTQLGAKTDRAPVPPDQVVIYRTADQVPGKYEEIALLNAAGDSFWTNEAKMHNRMKQEAGKLGANGVILDSMSEPSAGAKVAGAIFGVGAERKGRAIAIRLLPSVATDSATVHR